jgi:hypothetical protein
MIDITAGEAKPRQSLMFTAVTQLNITGKLSYDMLKSTKKILFMFDEHTILYVDEG